MTRIVASVGNKLVSVAKNTSLGALFTECLAIDDESDKVVATVAEDLPRAVDGLVVSAEKSWAS